MKLNNLFLVLLVFQTSCISDILDEGYMDEVYGPAAGTKTDPEKERRLTKKFNLPPDPGWWGKQSLLGIDADNDGLRDDVQRWIYFNYPEEPLVREAFRQVAVDRIENFKLINDKDKTTLDAYNKFSDSLNCAKDIFGLVYFKKIRDSLEWKKIDRIIVNTGERWRADSHVINQYFEDYPHWGIKFSTCRFEVEHPNKEEYLKKNDH